MLCTAVYGLIIEKYIHRDVYREVYFIEKYINLEKEVCISLWMLLQVRQNKADMEVVIL